MTAQCSDGIARNTPELRERGLDVEVGLEAVHKGGDRVALPRYTVYADDGHQRRRISLVGDVRVPEVVINLDLLEHKRLGAARVLRSAISALKHHGVRTRRVRTRVVQYVKMHTDPGIAAAHLGSM